MLHTLDLSNGDDIGAVWTYPLYVPYGVSRTIGLVEVFPMDNSDAPIGYARIGLDGPSYDSYFATLSIVFDGLVSGNDYVVNWPIQMTLG